VQRSSATLRLVRRFVFVILVVLLSVSASGVTALVLHERCGAVEQTRGGDTNCPPTCVTCGCCAQPIEPVVISPVSSPLTPSLAADVPSTSNLSPANQRDVLHVPKHV